ncbi:hypothetical protein H5410_037114, partial [Solanum commersonii]
NVSLSETAEPPSDFILPLLRYKKELLAWSLKQEESTFKGGILTDEMGMGKTIQAIALVLAQRESKKHSSILLSSPRNSQQLNVARLKKATKPLFIMALIGENVCTNWRNMTTLLRLTKGQKILGITARTQNHGHNGSVDNSANVGEDVSRRRSDLHSLKWIISFWMREVIHLQIHGFCCSFSSIGFPVYGVHFAVNMIF